MEKIERYLGNGLYVIFDENEMTIKQISITSDDGETLTDVINFGVEGTVNFLMFMTDIIIRQISFKGPPPSVLNDMGDITSQLHKINSTKKGE